MIHPYSTLLLNLQLVCPHINYKIYIHIILVMVILAEYSFFHTGDSLVKKLSDFSPSSIWAIVNKAVSQLQIRKKMFKLEDERMLEESILQIALTHRLVRIYFHFKQIL
jgi:hypothetical protein